MRTLNIGVIGAGNRGGSLAKNLLAIRGVAVIALADPDAERLTNLAEDLGIPPGGRFNAYQKMLALPTLDAVVVASPDYTHHAVVLEAARRKKHVFCEKPMALTLVHCLEMQKAVEKYGVVLMMGFCLRYNNLYRKVRALIADGAIGNLRLAHAIDSVERGSAYFFHSWHRLRRNSGGLLLQKATHSLDILNWMAASRPVSVYALGGRDVFGGREAKNKRCGTCRRKTKCPEFIDARRYHSDYLSGKAFVLEDKCVFAREIDILDNEVLAIRYANGVRADTVEGIRQ